MDSIESQLLKKYSEKEETNSFYELVQKVIPDRTIAERSTRIVITEKGIEREFYYRGRKQKFLNSKFHERLPRVDL